ncbi:MAG TPA: hypothetical protein VE090_06260 [Methylomirabilota bacterium]|nr:hypothetical protein [Methylomirabilota bacterium]
MKQKILIFLILFIELFVLFQWIKCNNFVDSFHYSSFDLQLRLIDSIHLDKSIPIWEVRLFHNKFVGFVFDIFAEYLQFWNIAFLASFLSLIGAVGLAIQFYYFVSKKKKHVLLWIIFFAILVVPFIEILSSFTVPFTARLILIALPFVVWSTLGWWQLVKQKNINWKIIGIMLVVSLWYQIIFPNLTMFCFLK